MAVLALSRPGGLVICNGYKDREYIRLALIGRKLGMNTFIVVEKPSELRLVMEEAQALGVEPILGVRMRLASPGAGKRPEEHTYDLQSLMRTTSAVFCLKKKKNKK